MEFLFYPVESKIYDFLFLPSMIHERVDSDQQNQNYYNQIPKEYIDFCLILKSRLSPYQSKLAKYYLEDADIIFLLATCHPFFNHTNAESYLDFLLTLDDKEILKTILYALQVKEWSTPRNEEAMILAGELIKNEDHLMPWINELSLSGDSKWKLLCFSKSPREGIKEYVQVMKEIEPIFNEVYASREEEVINYGKSFVQRLNTLEGDALDEITNGIVKNGSIPGEIGHFIISCISSYSVQIYVRKNIDFRYSCPFPPKRLRNKVFSS